MDNRVFNVNGKSKEEFLLAMKLAFLQANGFGKESTAKYWSYSQKHGLVFHQYSESSVDQHALPVPLTSVEAAELAWKWLSSDEAKKVELSGWFEDSDHDGSNSLGWRLYVNDWGHVGSSRGVVAAVTPAYLWHGK